MKKFAFPITLLLLTLTLSLASCDSLKQMLARELAQATVAEISKALKEALQQGIGKGADALALKDGFYKSAYKIMLPSDVRTVTDKLKGIPGFDQLENNLLEKMNRGAEDAAKEAKPIFVSAITGMTFADAKNILMGADNSATTYLNTKTNQQLYDKFKPKIVSSLDKVGAASLWKKAADTYNALPLINKKVNSDFGDYVTKEALKGLFAKVAEEEKGIRRNKALRTTSLMQKVFAEQDSNRK